MVPVEYPCHPSRNQDDEYSVASCDGPPDDLGVVRRPWDDRHAVLERVEFRDALLPTHSDNLVASVERVLHQVVAELPRRANDAHLHPALVHPSRLDARNQRRLTTCGWAGPSVRAPREEWVYC